MSELPKVILDMLNTFIPALKRTSTAMKPTFLMEEINHWEFAINLELRNVLFKAAVLPSQMSCKIIWSKEWIRSTALSSFSVEDLTFP